MDEPLIATVGTEFMHQTNGDESAALEEDGEALSVSVIRFVQSLWARRWLVFSVVAVGILFSLLFAFLQPKVYISTTTLMPPDNTSSYSGIMSMLSSSSSASLTSSALGLGTPGELFVGILKSRNVEDMLITRFGLMHYYKARYMQDARRSLAADTGISQDAKSGVVTISVKAHNPQLAADLAQGYVAELNRVVTEDSTSSARRERIFLEERLKDIKQDLDESSLALSQFSAKNKTIDITSQAKSMVDAGIRLQAELIEGRSQLAAQRQTYSEDNPRVKAAEARNAELERQIAAMGGTSRSNGENGSPYPSASQLPGLGLTYYDLQRKVQVNEVLWETLTKQYEVAKVEEAKQIPTVRVLDVANVPERKAAPVRGLIMVIGAMLSFLVACLAVFSLNYWQEMDSTTEPKKLITEIAGNFARLRRRSRS